MFGSDVNSKGYKVIKGCGVIQGDGIDIEVMKKVSCMRGDSMRSVWTCMDYPTSA